MKSPLGTHQGPAVRVLAVYHDEERANQGEEEARRELRDFPGIPRWIWLRFAMHTVLWSRLEFSHVLHVTVSMHTVCCPVVEALVPSTKLASKRNYLQAEL